VVGEAPSRTSDPHQALTGGRSGRFLAELAGLEPHQLGFLFCLVNLLPELPAEDRKDALMRSAGVRLGPALAGRRVLVLGRRVARALGLSAGLLEEDPGSIDALVLPHPSGLNRGWQDPELRPRVAALLRTEARRAAEGCLDELPAGLALPWVEAVANLPLGS
jgi:hypothetical protein